MTMCLIYTIPLAISCLLSLILTVVHNQPYHRILVVLIIITMVFGGIIGYAHQLINFIRFRNLFDLIGILIYALVMALPLGIIKNAVSRPADVRAVTRGKEGPREKEGK